MTFSQEIGFRLDRVSPYLASSSLTHDTLSQSLLDDTMDWGCGSEGYILWDSAFWDQIQVEKARNGAKMAVLRGKSYDFLSL